jgi:hypothetical protein
MLWACLGFGETHRPAMDFATNKLRFKKLAYHPWATTASFIIDSAFLYIMRQLSDHDNAAGSSSDIVS